MNSRLFKSLFQVCATMCLITSTVYGAYSEDGDNDSIATADSLNPLLESSSGFLTATMSGSFTAGTTDNDYWVFDAEAGDEISAWIEIDAAGTYPRLQLLNASGSVLKYDQYWNTSMQAFQNYFIPTPGTYYLKTYPSYAPGSEVGYTLRLDVGRGRQLESEDNNSMNQADGVAWQVDGSSLKGRFAGALYNNVDYLNLGHLNDGNLMSANFLFPDGSALDATKLSYEIQAPDGTVLQSGTNFFISYEVNTNAVHYLKLSSSTNSILAQYVSDYTIIDAEAPLITADTLPTEGSTNTTIISSFTVNFSEYMDLNSVTNPASWVLVTDGGDNIWGNGDDETYTLAPSYSANTLSTTLSITDGPIQAGQNVRLTGTTALMDQVGNPLSSAYVREFRIENIAEYVFENRNNGSIAIGTPLGSVTNVADGSYIQTQTLGVGDNPVDVVTADLDGDLNWDLVSVNYNADTISILFGNEDSTFTFSTNIVVGDGPRAVAVGRFNGDDYPDLAVANEGSDNISVLLGSGGGQFQPATAVATGDGPYSVTSADLDGDGHADLVTANKNGGNVTVLYGDGTGGFSLPSSQRYIETAGSGSSFAPVGTAQGWRGDDSWWEISGIQFEFPFYGNTYTNCYVDSNGNIKFDYGSRETSGSLSSLQSRSVIGVLWSDLRTDGDTTNDVYVDSQSDQITIRWAGAYYGSTEPINCSATLFSNGVIRLAYGDGNASGGFIGIGAGDGIAYQTSSRSSSGSMSNAADIVFSPFTDQQRNSQLFATSNGPRSVIVANLDGGTDLDLVVANYDADTVSVLINNGDGTFADAVNYAVGDGPQAVVAGDVNGDGILDLLVANYISSNVSVLLGQGDGTFTAAVNYDGTNRPYDLILEDIDADGFLDIAVASYSGNRLNFLINQGDGTFVLSGLYQTVSSYPTSIALGDFNGNGLDDLAVANSYNDQLYVYLANARISLSENPADSDLWYGAGRGQLSSSSDQDYWTFSGRAGDQVVIASETPGNPNSSGLSYRLLKPDGTTQLTYFYADSNGRGQSSVITLPSDGRYAVVVSYNYQYWSEYRVRVTKTALVQMESENNNNTSEANLVEFGVGTNGLEAVVGGYISSTDTLGDYFSLGNLTSGMVVNVSLQMPSSSDLLAETYLVGPDGLPIAFSDNQALWLGGTSADYGIVNTFSNFPTTTFTAEFWMRSSDTSKAGTPISYARDGQINEMILYDHRSFDPHVGGSNYDSGVAGNSGRWVHIAWSWDSVTGTSIMYKDGTAVHTNSNFKTAYSMIQSGVFVLGQEQDAVGSNFDTGQAYLGELDNLALWDIVRTPAQIQSDLSSGLTGSEPGLVGYWDFEDGTANDLTDFSNDIALFGNCSVQTSDRVSDPSTQSSYPTTFEYAVISNGIYYVRVRDALGAGGLLNQYLVHISMQDPVIPYVVSSSLPAEGSSSSAVIDRFTVDFSEEMAVDTATNSANYELRSAGLDGLLDTSDDAVYTLVPSYSSGLQVSLVISDGPIQSGPVRFAAKTGLQDRSGNPLREQFVQRFTLTELSGYTMENRNNGSSTTATPLGTYVPGETDGSFLLGNQYGVGNNPYAIVSADFDADGHLDFATADSSSDQITVMLGEGDGSFLLSTNIVVGDQPVSIDVGLINEDAHLDLAVVNFNSDTATVLLGDGLGGFSVFTNLYAGDAPRDIAIANMNNDGANDLVVCCESDDDAGILLGSGDGNFSAVTLQYCGDAPFALSVGDLNGDGTNDVATSNNNSDDLGVLFGNGDGTLQPVVRYVAGDQPRGVVIADLNDDSLADVVVANFNSDTVSIFRGTGGGTLTNVASVAIGNGPWGDILVQDFTGDGRMDLAMALYYAHRVAIMSQAADGTFNAVNSFTVNASYPIDTALGDVDEDGLLDILTANYSSHNVTVLLGSQLQMLSEIADGSDVFTGRGRGNIANREDYDYWSFSGEAGDQAVVALSIPGHPNNSALRFEVYRPDGTSMGYYYGSSTGGSAQSPVLTLPTTGRYTVRVSYNYEYWGEYHLAVQCVHPPMQLESENNDSTGNATVPTFGLRNGRQVADMAGFALFNTGYDYYNLGNLASGTVVQALIDYPSFSSEHPGLQLIDSSGAFIPYQSSEAGSNGVLNLDGSGDYLRTTTTNFSSRTGTVEGWVFPREAYDWGFWQTHDSTSVNWADWLAMFSYYENTFYFRSGNGYSDVTFNTQNYIPSYEWSHLAFTWEGTTMKAFVNGTLIASRTDATLQDVMDPFACFGLGHGRWLNGWMDELRVWDRALTLEEVTSVAQQTLIGNENGLVGYWNFDDDSSDLSGTRNDGDLMGNASLEDFGMKPYMPATNVTYVTEDSGIYYVRVAKGNGSVADQYVLHLSMYDSTIPIITDESLPANDSSSEAMINAFTVTFSEEMGVDTVTNSANFDLSAAGADDLFDTADDAPYTLSIDYSGGLTATFSIENGPVQPGLIRFTASTNVLDRTGTSLVAYTNSFRITNPDRYVFESQNNNTIGAAGNLNGFTTNLLDGTFSVDQTVSLAGNPVGMASGYFNADTNLDLAVVDMNADIVTVLLGNGDNTFSVATNMTVNDGPTSVKVGLINDDVIPDLAVSCFNNDSVAVLLGDGSGAFTNAAWYTAGNGPRNVVIGDLNNDGIADLATANEYGDNVGVLLGNGDGTFGTVSYTAAGDGAYDLALADFDADGTNDLAVANAYVDNVSILRGLGDGSFSNVTNLAVGDYPRSIAAADFNLDGRVDLACGNFNSDNVSVYLSAGVGQFSPVYTVWAGDAPYLTVQDLDGDLVPDLLTANEYSDSVSVLFGDGFGRFSAPVGSRAGDGPVQVIAGDFDGQAGLELAVVNRNDNMLMILTPNTIAHMNNVSADGLIKAQYGRGSLSDTSDVDYWTFDGQAGDQFSLAVDFPNGHSTYGSILRWQVYRPDGVQIINYVNDSYGYGQSAPVVLPMSGDYLLMVSYNYDYRDEYRFRVMTASDPVTLESESNNSTGTADQPQYTLQTGTRSARVLGLIHGNDTSGDYVELGNLGIGTTISLGIEWPLDSTLSAALAIYGPAGEVAALSPATNLVFNTVTNGMYYARIYDAASTRGFDAQYELQLSLSDSTAPEIMDVTLPEEGAVVEDIISTFAVEFSESMDAATVTNSANYQLVGAGVDGVLDSVDDEIYPLQVTMNAGGASVSMGIDQPPLQPGLTRLTVSTALKDLLGNRLASPYVRTFTITDGGAGSSESRYNDEISAAMPIELAEGPDGLWTGTGRGAMFNSADVDYFSFSATNGQSVVLGADIETYAYYHRLRFQLRSSNDAVLAELVTPVSVNRGQTAPYTIPADGTYYVRVSAVDNYFGEYRVHVMAADDPLTLESEDNGNIGSADTVPMVTSPTNAVGSIAGYVSSNSDNDYFKIGTVTNDQTILVGVRTPDDSGLVPVVSVYNSSGSYQDEIGATGDGSAEVRIETSNAYYVVIRSGENTGGLGKDYILDVEVLPTSAVVIPNLNVTQITLPSEGGIQSGDEISLTYQVQNTGSAPTEEGSWFDRIVLSSNKVMGDADDYSLGTFPHIGNLDIDESYVASPSVTLPDGISGNFYIVVYTDFADLVDERLFEGDNISASASTFAVALADYPDLVVENLQVSGSNEVGQAISITWTTANRGALGTSGDVQERLRILRADNGAELYHQDVTVSALAVGATASNAVSYTTALAVPHQIVVTTDYGNTYFEYDAVSHASAEQNSASVTKSIYRYYNVNLTSKPSDGGNVSGGGHYPEGTVITVSAAADTSLLPYTFMNWSEYGSFRNASTNYTFMVTRNVNLTANFGLPQLRIDAVRVPSAGGSVTGAGAYNYGSTTVLKAFANPGYAFDRWQEGETYRGIDQAITNVLYTDRVMTAYFRELNPTHTVTTASDPADVAVVSGAGYYTNGNSVVFSAPLSTTNGPNRYMFKELTLNGSLLATTNEYLNVFTTLQPSNMLVVAKYTAQPLDPQVKELKRNLKDPVPATTNFAAALVFDRSMQTNLPPLVVFTNMTAPALSFDVPTDGTWGKTYLNNDTYTLKPISFIAGDDGDYGVLVSRVTDLYGSTLTETNAATVSVNATPPDNPTFAVVASNAVSVTVGWSSYVPPADISGYRLYRETSSFTNVAGLSPVGFAGATNTTGVIGGIELDKDFYVAVAAVDVAGNRNPEVSSIKARVNSVIPTPVSPTSTTVGATGARLSWSSYDTTGLFGLEGYHIYWAQSDFSNVSGLTPYASVSAAQKMINISGIDRTKNQYFAVVGYNRLGEFNPNVSTVLWQDPYSGTIDYDLTIGTDGADFAIYDIYNNMSVSGGAVLTIEPGVTLRFHNGKGLSVQGTLTALGTVFRPIVMTSSAAEPKPGDWAGLYLGPGADASDLAHVRIEYGQGLDIDDCAPTATALTLMYNRYSGLTLEGTASMTTTDLLSQYNDIGLEQLDSALLTVNNSIVMNNGTNAVAGGVSPLSAANVWWGSADDSEVLAGFSGTVAATPHLTREPLLTPAADTIGGVRDVGSRTVGMRYACRIAESMRVSEDSTFDGVFFSDFAETNAVLLSEGGGEKTLYIQFRNVNGVTNSPIAVPVNYITTGPSIDAFNLAEGQTVARPFIVSCAASSPLGVAASEFYVDDVLMASTNAASMQVLWDVREETAGIHRVKYLARDTHGEFSVREVNVRVAPSPPLSPAIVTPTNGTVTASASVVVTGTAEPFIGVRMVRNGAVVGETTANVNGAFTGTIDLFEGANNLAATAFDDQGDAMSPIVRVIHDTGAPVAPVLDAPIFSVGDGISLSWRFAETGERATSYRVYWNTVPFTNTVDAASSSKVVYGMNYAVRGLSNGTYYFGVVGYDGANNASPLSNVQSIDYDTTPPSFSIGYNKSSPVGPGVLHMVLTSSEPLSGLPDLLVLPNAARGPTPLVVSNTAPNTFEADFNITALTLSGPAQVRLSASDIYGNPFSGAPEGVDLVIDTTPPSGKIETVPVTPVQVLSNMVLQVQLTLTEPLMQGTVPQLTLDPPAGAIVDVTMSGSGTNWNGTVTLNPLMGSGFCTFNMVVRDAFGNTGTTITSGKMLEIYNTPYPSPPDAPNLLNPVSQKGGYVHLIWYPVDNAETYNLYRIPGESGTPTTIVTSGITTNSIDDLPPADGNYRYAVSAERRGSESGLSTIYTKVSDRTPPGAPTNLVVQLKASGVQVSWTAPEGDSPIRYNVYRNGNKIADRSPPPTPVSDYPPRGMVSYNVTSADWLGNEASSETNEFSMLVPAVASFSVLMNEDQPPLLSWTKGDGSIVGVNLYRNGIKLNNLPNTAENYQDNAYSGSSLVEYSVKSVDSEGNEGPARVASVYRIDMDLNVNSSGAGLPILNYFDRYEVSVENQTFGSSLPVQSVELRRTYSGGTATTVSLTTNTTVAASASADLVLPMAGMKNSTAQSVRVRLMQETGPTGAQVVYERLYSFATATPATPMLSLTVTNSVTAGALNNFKMRIYNRGLIPMDVVGSRSRGGADGDIYLSVRNALGQELSRVQYRGSLPGMALTSSGVGYVTVQPGSYIDVPFDDVLIPESLSAAGSVTVRGGVERIYHLIGTAEEQVAGPLVGAGSFSLVLSDYYGTAFTAKTSYANDEPIVITGQALRRSDDTPLANTPLHLGFAIGEFRWFEDLVTDSNGSYEFSYEVPTGVSGELAIWAAHPDVVDRIDQVTIGIYRMYVLPRFGDVRMSKNNDFVISLNLMNPGAVALEGLDAEVNCYEMVGTNKVAISSVTATPQFNQLTLDPNGLMKVPVQLHADMDAPDKAIAEIRFFSSVQGAADTFTGDLTLLEAVPVLSVVEPSSGYVDVTVNRGRSIMRTVTVVNRGLRDLKGVTMSPASTHGWMQAMLQSDPDGVIHLPDMPVGSSNAFDVVFVPPESLDMGRYDDKFVISGTNYTGATFNVPLYATVSSADRGDVQFFVQNSLSLPVPGATVRLRNSLLGTELDPVKTGTNGVLTVNDLQEGLWYWQVSAAGHSTQAGSVEIIPDQTVNVETRLVKSVVTVNFSVVPVPFTDRYEIVIEQTFETHVPAPVLVLTPTYQEFSDVAPGFNTRFTLTAKNHGLIRLEDVTIEGQSFDWGSTTPLIEYLPSLEPFQEVQIPVKVEFWGDEGVSGQSERNSSYSSCVGDMFSAIDNFVDNLFNLIDQLNGRYNCVNSLDFLRTGSMSSMIIREALEQVLDSDYVTSSDMMKVAVMIGCAFADNGGGGDGGGGGGGGGTSYGGSAPACFDPSTRVLLASGETVIIDTLAVGDRIKSGLEDHETAEVAEVVRGTASHWVRIWFDDDPDDELLVTAEHLIWVDGAGKGWTAAQNLSVGDRVVTSSGARVKVAKLEEIQEDRPLVTVRLNGDIALFANGVLVHDQCGWWAPAKTTEEELEVAP